jgi:hypothetical protein
MGFENIYEIEISESMINLGCYVKLLTGNPLGEVS